MAAIQSLWKYGNTFANYSNTLAYFRVLNKNLGTAFTHLRLKLVYHKLACIGFPTKKLPDFYNNRSLQR